MWAQHNHTQVGSLTCGSSSEMREKMGRTVQGSSHCLHSETSNILATKSPFSFQVRGNERARSLK